MSGKALPGIALLLAVAFPAGVGAVTIPPPVLPQPGTVVVTRTATTGGRTVKASSHTYRNVLLADFRSFWTRGLAGQTLANRLVLYPVLDTWEGTLGCKRRIVFDEYTTCPLRIRASHVSYKMNEGYLGGKGGKNNTVTLTYTTYKNYVDARYTLSKLDFPSNSGRRGALGYNPTVRTYFDAALNVTLAAPYSTIVESMMINPPPSPIGPVKITAVSVTVSNVRFVGGRNRAEVAAIEGVISHLGNRSYAYSYPFGQNCLGCDYLDGKPFPTWTPWLGSSLRSLLGAAAPGFSSISVMNDFLNESQAAGANTSKLGYSSFNGVSLLTSGPGTLQLQMKGNAGLRGVPIVNPSPSATPGHR